MKKLFILLTLLVGIGCTSVFFTACNNEDDGLKTQNTVSFQQKIKLRGTVLCYAWKLVKDKWVRVVVRCECYFDTRTGMLYVIENTAVELTADGTPVECIAFNPDDKGNPNPGKFSFVGVDDGVCYASFTQDEMLKHFNTKEE
ncbi:MAG: hypothetical protein Q4Q06_05330 [Bacteroidota bacterium]|nr:hypothetical protein [Bacteroidota bacterium]